MYCFITIQFIFVCRRCNQTAFRGSPLYHAAIASLQRAQVARVKWQPGYRTQKRWTGVQKVSSCPVWPESKPKPNKKQNPKRWIMSATSFTLIALIILTFPCSFSPLFLFYAPAPSLCHDSGSLPASSLAPSQQLNLVLAFPLTSTHFSLLSLSFHHFLLASLAPGSWGSHTEE